jgi:hypothetical protein
MIGYSISKYLVNSIAAYFENANMKNVSLYSTILTHYILDNYLIPSSCRQIGSLERDKQKYID